MKFTITLTESFRKNLIITLSLIKNILVAVGLSLTLLCALGFDLEGDIWNRTVIGAVIGLGLAIIGMILELFVVMCLVRDNEHIDTIFYFKCYGIRSTAAYKEYKAKLLRAKKMRNKTISRKIISSNDQQMIG